MVEFKKFKIGDLFNRAQLGDTNLKKSDLTDTGDVVITSGKTNCGVLGRTTRKAKLFPAKTLTIDMFGFVYYRDFPYKMVTHGRVMSLSSDIIKNREIGLYLAGSFSYLSEVFSYDNMATWKKVQRQDVLLPVTSTGDPDFAYMARRIDELEAQRIDELEAQRIDELSAYLKVSGLDNTELTNEEKDALTKKVTWKKFRIGDLFSEPDKGDVDLHNSDINGRGYYFINSGSTNLGIKGKTTREAKIFPANTITIDFFGNAYYRDFEYKLATHNHVFSFDDPIIKNKEVGLYLVSAFSYLKKVFAYNNMLTWKKLQDMHLTLPVASTGAIDFAYMQNYITAIEKQSIKGVIAYKDKVIATTKKIVSE